MEASASGRTTSAADWPEGSPPQEGYPSASGSKSLDETEDIFPGAEEPEGVTDKVDEQQQAEPEPEPEPEQAVAVANQPHSAAAAPARRVKVYQLDGESWQDLGTGYCDVHARKPPGQLRHHNSSSSEDHQQLWPDEDAEDENGPWIAVTPEHAGASPTEGENQHKPAAAAPAELIWRTAIRSVMLMSLNQGEEEEEHDPDAAFGYHRQQDTLIVWTEADGVDMALSFANVQACGEVWSFIQRVKASIYEGNLGLPFDSSCSSSSSDEHAPSSPQLYASHSGHGSDAHSLSSQSGTLPAPSFDNIIDVLHSLKWQARTPMGRERIATWIVKTDYVSQLIALKSDAEDLESIDTLHALCSIVQTLLLLNDNFIFDHVMQDHLFLGVAGILEYDPEFPKMKANYVAHLSDPARFVQVVPISHQPTLIKIHQTYRLSYLKDVILARIIDDPTYTMLNSFIFFHQVDIVQHLQQDQLFIQSLFHLFEQSSDSHSASTTATKEPTPPPQKQREGILLLHQFCTFAKNLQNNARHAFYRNMVERGLLRVLELVLQRTAHLEALSPGESQHNPSTATENAVRVTTIEILMMVIDHHPNAVRAYCLRSVPDSSTTAPVAGSDSSSTQQEQPPQRSLVSFLIALLISEADMGIQAQMAEAIKTLVQSSGNTGDQPGADPSNIAGARFRTEDPEAERFLQYFYDHCMSHLFKPILDLPQPEDQPHGRLALPCGLAGLCAHLCDLLAYFVGAHTFRSKYFVLSTPICSQVARLFRTTQKHLALAALRFFKSAVLRKDDFYNRYLLKHDLLQPILAAACHEGGKDNLVSSACLDFFEHIRLNNVRALLNYIMDQHADQVRSLAGKQPTIKLLVMRWEQNNEPPPSDSIESRNAGNKAGPHNRPTGTLEAEEESYFNDDSSEDEEEQPSTSKHGSGARPAPLSPSNSGPPSKKRKVESGEGQKRQRTNSATASPKGSAMVRSPALVFQEMAQKSSRGRPRTSSSSSSGSGGEAPSPAPLVDYGEEEDEPTAKASIAAEAPSTPPGKAKQPADQVLSNLGSPYQSLDTDTPSILDTLASDDAESADGHADAEGSAPLPSLKSLGEKRQREEDEDDVLASVERKRSKTQSNSAPNGSAAASNKAGKGFANGLTSKLKLNFGLGKKS